MWFGFYTSFKTSEASVQGGKTYTSSLMNKLRNTVTFYFPFRFKNKKQRYVYICVCNFVVGVHVNHEIEYVHVIQQCVY